MIDASFGDPLKTNEMISDHSGASPPSHNLVSFTYDSAEEPPFLFVIDAKSACGSITKLAIDKLSWSFIPTRKK